MTNETYLLIHPDFAKLGRLARKGSQIRLAGVDAIDLGECETLEEIRRALVEVEAEGLHALRGTGWRVDWAGGDWLLDPDDLRGGLPACTEDSPIDGCSCGAPWHDAEVA